MIEAIGYVGTGFIATLAAMEVAWRMAKKRTITTTAPIVHAATAARVK